MSPFTPHPSPWCPSQAHLRVVLRGGVRGHHEDLRQGPGHALAQLVRGLERQLAPHRGLAQRHVLRVVGHVETQIQGLVLRAAHPWRHEVKIWAVTSSRSTNQTVGSQLNFRPRAEHVESVDIVLACAVASQHNAVSAVYQKNQSVKSPSGGKGRGAAPCWALPPASHRSRQRCRSCQGPQRLSPRGPFAGSAAGSS